MAINKTPVPDARLNMKIRAQFLDHLAETANVSASARAAGVASSAVYAERRRSPAFRDAWALALAEGYARLETDLLAEALQTASGRTADGTLKARAQKHRLAISLLSAHRASVHGRALRNPDGSVYVEWTRRSRLDLGWIDGVDQAQAEDAECYRVTLHVNDVVIREWTVGANNLHIPAADIATLDMPQNTHLLFTIRHIGRFAQSNVLNIRI